MSFVTEPVIALIGAECKRTYSSYASTLTSVHRKIAYMRNLRARVIEIRQSMGLNQSELAAVLNVTPSAVNQLERQTLKSSKSIKAETALRLAQKSGYRVEYIVFGNLPKQAYTIQEPSLAYSEPNGDISAEELELLGLYRAADTAAKVLIFGVARLAAHGGRGAATPLDAIRFAVQAAEAINQRDRPQPQNRKTS